MVAPGYRKNDPDFRRVFLHRVDRAIENSRSFETDLSGLGNHLGSNVGMLIERMRSNR